MNASLDQFTIIKTKPFSELLKIYVICLYYCKHGSVDQLSKGASFNNIFWSKTENLIGDIH